MVHVASVTFEHTIDREIYIGKIFHLLSFHVVKFSVAYAICT